MQTLWCVSGLVSVGIKDPVSDSEYTRVIQSKNHILEFLGFSRQPLVAWRAAGLQLDNNNNEQFIVYLQRS